MYKKKAKRNQHVYIHIWGFNMNTIQVGTISRDNLVNIMKNLRNASFNTKSFY